MGPPRGFSADWGINGVLTYASGLPIALTSSYVLPLYGATNGRSIPYVTSYNGWQPNWNGKFDPSVGYLPGSLLHFARHDVLRPIPLSRRSYSLVAKRRIRKCDTL